MGLIPDIIEQTVFSVDLIKQYFTVRKFEWMNWWRNKFNSRQDKIHRICLNLQLKRSTRPWLDPDTTQYTNDIWFLNGLSNLSFLLIVVVNSVSKWKAQPMSLAFFPAFLVIFLPTTLTSFTKLRFYLSFWGSKHI